MALRDDYSGPFEPGLELTGLSRGALATLGREYMMMAQLDDRVAMPPIGRRLGQKGMSDVACDEWMGASPIYTQRTRRALGFEGSDVETIFKGLQLDVGWPHQYFQVHYELESELRGTFQVESCGALLDVEPLGERAVKFLCHDMEDPTFDATAVATNPRARMRPIHRPPRQPADRLPHCHWVVEIDPAADPVQEIPLTQRVRRSRLAQLELARTPDAEPGGWTDYDRPLDPEFQLEDLSHGALVAACREFMIQDHLLVYALMASLTERLGAEVAREVAEQQWIGAGWVMAERLHRALRIPDDGAEAILKVLQLHPAFADGYVRLGFELVDAARGRFWIEDCDALQEEDPFNWLALLGDAPSPALDAMVQAVNPRARCSPVPAGSGARLAWEVVVDPSAGTALAPPPVELARSSGGSRFAFERVRALRR